MVRELARHAPALRPPPAALRGAGPEASADFTTALHRSYTRCVELLRPRPAEAEGAATGVRAGEEEGVAAVVRDERRLLLQAIH